MQNVYIPLLTYAHASGKAGSEVIPGLAEEPAEDHQRRQDLHADPAQGPQVLRRHPGQGLRLPQRGRADVQGRLRRKLLLRRHRRRCPVRDDEEGQHLGDQDQRSDGRDHHRPDRAPRHVHKRAGPDVHRPGPPGYSGQEPDARPTGGDRAVRDHQIGPGAGLDPGAKPAVGEEQREDHAGPAQRPHRQVRHQGGPQPVLAGQRHRAGQCQLDVRPAARPTATRRSRRSTTAPSSGSNRGSTPTTSG